MDFALVEPSRLTWSTPVKNKSQCVYGSEKVRFQTPKCLVKMSPCLRFQGALELAIQSDTTFPRPFMECIDAMAQSAQRSLGESVLGHRTYYHPLKTLRAFDDVLVFDRHGDIIKDPLHKKGIHCVSMLLQLDGLWLSEMSWGLRFRVVQLKLHEECVRPLVDEEAPRVTVLYNGQPCTTALKPFLFVSDD